MTHATMQEGFLIVLILQTHTIELYGYSYIMHWYCYEFIKSTIAAVTIAQNFNG